MYTLFMILLFVLSALLMIVVLLQPSKGDMISTLGGIGGQFTSVFGARGGMEKLHKITVGLAIAIVVISILVNKVGLDRGQEVVAKPVVEGTSVPTQRNPIMPPLQRAQPQQQQTPSQQPAKQ
jgi:protein translocase SecG subunit